MQGGDAGCGGRGVEWEGITSLSLTLTLSPRERGTSRDLENAYILTQ